MDNQKTTQFEHQSKKDMSTASLTPQGISLGTFHRLLSCYEATVSQVHRRKSILKLQPKQSKGSKGKSSTPVTKIDLNASQEAQVREQTDKFLELDRWRYESLPKTVLERKSDGWPGMEGAFILKDELISIMDWKMWVVPISALRISNNTDHPRKHGVFRPALMGMIKGIPDKSVKQATSSAFASLPNADPNAPLEPFPKSSLDALTAPLRGVGPATASLILSIGTGSGDSEIQVPFYSDDVYLWLVLNDLPESADQEEKSSIHRKPSGELIAKYNVNEYRDLWNAVQQLRARLNAEVGNLAPVSLFDIEKVAYVIRNIALSGFIARDPEVESTQSSGMQMSAEKSQDTEPSSKRKLRTEVEAKQAPRRENKRLRK
ncbi:unnamed protein product [Penicillium salamii]|uniref:Uncharacterized protein n=1 Tax=Penicillium salamii TaxID=1612424 RepID=A0A9W4J1K4_9EURO|nr:unnamed protein product [Penicillium salamii]CAG8160800.1 unnamed protein product [Penicillium salamii]CAG8373351.1 unnamed protein product [Penicillium salamii]CAG8381100.1 unnamed protein product [Penicillium salamii]CAG8383014.1 unnamed protein product [Penicillium salamii]